jgi:hypothetical protein
MTVTIGVLDTDSCELLRMWLPTVPFAAANSIRLRTLGLNVWAGKGSSYLIARSLRWRS